MRRFLNPKLSLLLINMINSSKKVNPYRLTQGSIQTLLIAENRHPKSEAFIWKRESSPECSLSITVPAGSRGHSGTEQVRSVTERLTEGRRDLEPCAKRLQGLGAQTAGGDGGC